MGPFYIPPLRFFSEPLFNGNEWGTLHHPSFQDWSLTIWMFSVISTIPIIGRSYLYAEMQTAYSTASAFWLGRLAFVPDGRSINGRFEAERPPASAGPPSGERAAFLTPIHPLYSTRPHGLGQVYILAYVPGSRFRSVILPDSLDPHCT